jgi:hypothetical protein
VTEEITEEITFDVEKFYDMVHKQMEEIDNSFVYYPLREWGLQIVPNKSIQVTKASIIIDRLGFKVTNPMLEFVLNKEFSNIGSTTSRLGDKNVLRLVGYTENKGTDILTYEVSEEFKKILKF